MNAICSRLIISALLLLVFQTSNAYDSMFKITDIYVGGLAGTSLGSTKVKVGEITSSQKAKANLLFLPGFADTFDNHTELLKSASESNYNVIAFDYPGHGQSEGSIRNWGLLDLAQIIPKLTSDRRLSLDPSLPLVIAGWSTGATIAIRIAQSWSDSVLPGNFTLAGILAIAPALPAKVVFSVDKNKLTSGSMKHGPKPTKVPLAGQFAASITTVSRTAQMLDIPSSIEALFLAAGEKDAFAKSSGTVSFVRSSGKNVQGFTCPKALHGLEFEPNGIGSKVRSLSISFLKNLIIGKNSKLPGDENCKFITKN